MSKGFVIVKEGKGGRERLCNIWAGGERRGNMREVKGRTLQMNKKFGVGVVGKKRRKRRGRKKWEKRKILVNR